MCPFTQCILPTIQKNRNKNKLFPHFRKAVILKQALSLDLSSVAAYCFHTDYEKQYRTATDGYKTLGCVVIPQELFLERSIPSQQGESQLPATNVIPNSRVIFPVVMFQPFCCMDITQTTVLKDCDVFPAAFGLFPTELPANACFGSSKVIQVGAFKSLSGWVMVPSLCKMSLILGTYLRGKKGHFSHNFFSLQIGA